MIEDRDNPPTALPPAGHGIGTTAREAGAAPQDRAGDLRGAARTTLEDARSAAVEQSEAAKGQAADELARTARGLEAAAAELEGSPFQQDLLREAADGLQQISRAVQGKSIGALVEDLSEFGRRNPLAYLGGAALAGFALARFAKASPSSEDARYGLRTPDVPAASGLEGPDNV